MEPLVYVEGELKMVNPICPLHNKPMTGRWSDAGYFIYECDDDDCTIKIVM
jgi:hypothetical protein